MAPETHQKSVTDINEEYFYLPWDSQMSVPFSHITVFVRLFKDSISVSSGPSPFLKSNLSSLQMFKNFLGSLALFLWTKHKN